MKMKKGSLYILLLVTLKWKLLGCSWNFHVWNPKRPLFMLHFIRSTEFRVRGRYMICMVWICPNLVNLSTWMLTIWHKKTMCFGFSFFYFFEFYTHIFESLWNPSFDQDLNKFRTWKWKGKLGSFLVTL